MLQPGGHALLAFHVRDAAAAPGGQVQVCSWWGEPAALTFRFLDPAHGLDLLVRAGLEQVARLDRAPGPGEQASERCYLLVRRPG